MDKLIVNDRGEAQITNDGATILKLLDIVHPAARTLVDIARAQDAEVGDGTTSVVLIAAQLLKEIKGYIEEDVSPHIIMKGFRQAAQLVRVLVFYDVPSLLTYTLSSPLTTSKRFRSQSIIPTLSKVNCILLPNSR
jgi:TCP-1/cpn60 chaperonin family